MRIALDLRILKVPVLLLILFTGLTKLSAQEYHQQQAKYAAITIGINGLMSGLGATINKKPHESFGEVFVKGFGKGCLGGAFVFAGRSLTYQVYNKQNAAWIWPSRIISSIGNSIIQNSADNICLWERWQFNFGFIRAEYNIPDKQFTTRIALMSLNGFVLASRFGSLNPWKSLTHGFPVFDSDGRIELSGREYAGLASTNSVVINTRQSNRSYHRVLAHELMHVLQYENAVYFNSLAKPIDNYLKTGSKLYRRLSRALYLDLNRAFISLMAPGGRSWSCRYLEQEAEFFATHSIVRCR